MDDEVYQNMPDYDGRNVALLDMPKKSNKFDASLLKDYKDFMLFRADVYKAIEELRVKNEIGSSQDCDVLIGKTPILEALGLDKDLEELSRLLVVSKVKLGSELKVTKATGEKCPRCWNYVDSLEEVDEETHVCHRCHEALRG